MKLHYSRLARAVVCFRTLPYPPPAGGVDGLVDTRAQIHSFMIRVKSGPKVHTLNLNLELNIEITCTYTLINELHKWNNIFNTYIYIQPFIQKFKWRDKVVLVAGNSWAKLFSSAEILSDSLGSFFFQTN